MATTNVKERMRLFARRMNLTNHAIEKCMGMSKGMLGNDCKINADAVSLFLIAYPEASADWIMCNRGEMFVKENLDNEDLVNIYGEEHAIEYRLSQNNNNGNINNGEMTNSSQATNDYNQYKELLAEKDERIADLKEMVSLLKDQINILKNGK